MSEELKQLREALRRVKHEAASLADAQVIALEALTAAQPAQTDNMGMPTSCGKPLCAPDEHHPLCKLHKPAQAAQVPEGWEVASYAVGEITIQRMKQIDGRFLWKIANQVQSVLNKQGEWEWEPMPSSRDDEFLARCRYASLDEVAKALAAQQGAAQ